MNARIKSPVLYQLSYRSLGRPAHTPQNGQAAYLKLRHRDPKTDSAT